MTEGQFTQKDQRLSAAAKPVKVQEGDIVNLEGVPILSLKAREGKGRFRGRKEVGIVVKETKIVDILKDGKPEKVAVEQAYWFSLSEQMAINEGIGPGVTLTLTAECSGVTDDGGMAFLKRVSIAGLTCTHQALKCDDPLELLYRCMDCDAGFKTLKMIT